MEIDVLVHFVLLSQVCKLLKHISGTESLIIWSEHIESIFKCQTAEVTKTYVLFSHKLNYLFILLSHFVLGLRLTCLVTETSVYKQLVQD